MSDALGLFLLGAGMGMAGGLFPSPLHLIALSQVALNRWPRAIFILVVPPVIIDTALLVMTFFFYRYIPTHIARFVSYGGGSSLVAFAGYSLVAMRGKSQEELAQSASFTYASITVAALSELTAPGTWVYWLTIAGPILAEGREKGYWHVVPFFGGGFVGYYGAAMASVWLIAWGAGLHEQFKKRLLLAANLLLLVLGVSYLFRAYRAQ